MHIKGTPKDMQENPVYEALIPEILDYLRASIRTAIRAGVEMGNIIIDPGIGFGKTTLQNLEILRDLEMFTGLGLPVMVGPSRKAFISKVSGGLPVEQRLAGTLAAVSIAIMNGASIVRVHDVKETVMAARVADAVKYGRVIK